RLRPRPADERVAGGGTPRHRRRRARLTRDVEAALARLPVRRRELEALEVEGRRHSAADQGPRAERARRLPDAARHDGLRQLALVEVDADAHMAHALAVAAEREFERRAGVVMPDLVGIDPMPVRALAGLQQEVDGGRGAARLVGRAVHLAKMPALGMRLQPEAGNDLGGGHAEDQAGGGTVAFTDGVLAAAANHLASLGRAARQSLLAKRKSR